MTKRQQSSIRAALMLGVAFFLMRLWASGGEDLLLAIALTLMEFSAVLFLEIQAKRIEPLIEAWRAHEAETGRAEAGVAAAAEETARRQALLDGAIAERNALEQEIEDDWALSDLKGLISIAKNAIRSGYFRGIAANGGEIGGLGVVA